MASNSNGLRLVDISESNFSEFKEMVVQQADHHFCDYVGCDKKFFEEITDPSSPAHVMLAWDSSEDQAVGYVLYNKIYTLKGSEIYIEDIITRDGARGRGVGDYFFDELKELAREEQHDAVSWVVARNNVHAIRFYKDKQGALPRKHVGYDCTDSLLKDDFNVVAENEVAVRNLIVGEIPALVKDSSHGLTEDQSVYLSKAVKEDHVQTMLATDSNGEPLAVLVANPNFSSFRTVYGYKIEVLELTNNNTQAMAAFSSLNKELSEVAVTNGNNGHMVLFIDPHSDVQQEFVDHINAEPFKMSDHPNSFLDLYAIGEDVIHPNGVPEKNVGEASSTQFFFPDRRYAIV